MTITWPTSSTTICHGNTRVAGDAQGPDGLVLRAVPSTRAREYVGGGGPVFEDLGNTLVEVSFNVTRIYATGLLAAAAAPTFEATTVLGTLAYGSTTVVGALREVRVVQQGAALRIAYQFAGKRTA
jgi:hypothetical protein